ncbi:MAG: cysteine--tRNA ligase, partial [Acidimicrobiia bacterium]
MQVHSTLHRGVVELVPRRPDEISIYVCGATVQSEPHLGHGRYAVVFDMIRRYLVWRGIQVEYVRNITDIDDKIIAAAADSGESVAERAERMTALFADAYERLGVLAPDVEPKATEHVPEMLKLIERLIDRGLAYPVPDGDVYFAVRAFEGYGKLSGRKVDELRVGARVEISELKHDPLDFALWKAAKPGEPAWDSPWGPGRPGWHIECSAMAARYLGEAFDIHGGGSDLVFPHHENEIAQSEGATGQTFARYWLHNGMVNLGGEKMSKSTGRLIDLTETIDRFGGMPLRLFFLRAHYRSPIEFSEELLAAAGVAYQRLYRFMHRAPQIADISEPELMGRFAAAMNYDFGTPEALAILFEAVTEANRILDAQGEA